MVYPPARQALASPPCGVDPARVVLAVVSALLIGLGIVALGGCTTVWAGDRTGRSSGHPHRICPAPRPSDRSVAADHDPWDMRLSRPPAAGESGQPVQLAASRPFLTHSGVVVPGGSRRSLRPAGTSVRALVAKRARRLAPCFTQARGVVHLELLIRPSGRVGRISTPGTAPASVRRCVRLRARQWTFGPLPRTVRHRLTLRALGEAR